MVRTAGREQIALSDRPEHAVSLPFISEDLATAISQKDWKPRRPAAAARILNRCNWRWRTAEEKPDVIYLTGGSARSPLISKAL